MTVPVRWKWLADLLAENLGGAATLDVGTTAGTVAAGNDSRIVGAAQKSANLSDLASASTSRTNLGLGGAAILNVGQAAGTVAAGNDSRIVAKPLVDGAGGALVGDRIFDRGAYRPQGANLDLSGTSAVKAYTVPAGFYALFGGFTLVNTTASGITFTMYVMADSVTTPGAGDRFGAPSAGASGATNFTTSVVLDEGYSIWYQASAAPGLSVMASLVLIPKTPPSGCSYTYYFQKNLSVGDHDVFTGPASGNTSLVIGGSLHNTTASTIIVTTKFTSTALGRQIVSGYASFGSAGTANWFGGSAQASSVMLAAADKITLNTPATGMNVAALLMERPIAGSTT